MGFIDELRHVLTLSDNIKTLAMALAAVESSEKGGWVRTIRF